jgi:hypothetical protein
MAAETSSDEEYTPRYKWRETWPGEGHQDFEGYDGKDVVGRIQIDETTSGKEKMWRWNGGFASWIRRRLKPQEGWMPTPREAARMAEEHYDKLKEMHGR